MDEVVAPLLEEFAPTWLLISAGYDAHRDDPITGLGLSAADYAALTRRLVGLVPPGRVITFLEGGYSLTGLRDSVAASIPVLAGGSATVPAGEERHERRSRRPGGHRRGRALAPAPGGLIRPRTAPSWAKRTYRAPLRGADTAIGPAVAGRSDAREDVAVLDLDQVLREAVERGASDIHIKVGSPPHIRLDGELVTVSSEPVQAADTERVAFAVMPKIRAEEFIATNEADFAYALERRRPIPRQRVPPARLGRDGAAAHPPGHPADGGARAPAGRAAGSPRRSAASSS